MDWGFARSDNKMLLVPDEQLRRYNVWDLYATHHVKKALIQELKDNFQYAYWQDRIVPLVPAVLDMQARGLLVDREARDSYREKLRKELRQTEKILLERDPNLDLNSPKQRAKFLYETLGLRAPKLTETGQQSTDQDSIDRILKGLRHKDEHARPYLYAMFHRSRLNTILSRYLDVPIEEDGRVRARVRMYGAETGRWSYTKPALHQYPEECRHIFVSAPGHTFIAGDYSQLEARVFAYFAKDELMLMDFAMSRDPHISNALVLFHWDRAQFDALEPTKREAARNAAKTFLYGVCLYGGQAETLHTKLYCPCPACEAKSPPTIHQTRAELRVAQDRWFSVHTSALVYRDSLVKKVCGKGGTHSYTNPFGRRRFFTAPWPTIERELYNAPVQTTAMDIICEAQRRLYALGAPIVLQHHDSLLLEVPNGRLEYWLRVLQEEMERPVPEMDGMIFPVKLMQGASWGTLEKVGRSEK